MVVFYLRNSRIPQGKIVPVTVSLTNDVLKADVFIPTASGLGFPDLTDLEGEQYWILVLTTTERDNNGNLIEPEFVNLLSQDTLHEELESALGRLGQKIDWGDPLPDTRPPAVISITPPLDQIENVSIRSNVVVRLKDKLPAAGMDLSTLNISINGFPIVASGVVQPNQAATLKGNIFDQTITYMPKRILD